MERISLGKMMDIEAGKILDVIEEEEEEIEKKRKKNIKNRRI